MNRLKTTLFFIALCLFSFGQRTYTNSSVLSTGDWYKVGIKQNGVYKIDYAYLTSAMGVNGNVQFANFGIFTKTTGIIAEENSAPYIDDLAEISIKIIDQNNNGRFENGDYVLFYGKGPNQWHFDTATTKISHTKNIYTDWAGYFISTTQGGNHNFTTETVGAATININNYHNWQLFEEDASNLAKSGRQWLSAPLSSFESNRTITFNVPNIISSEPVVLNTRVAANASTGNSAFTISQNNITVHNQNLSPVGTGNYPDAAKANYKSGTFNTNSSNINIKAAFTSENSNARGYIDYIELIAKCNLTFESNFLQFRNTDAAGQIANYNLSNANGAIEIWNVTIPYNITRINATSSGNNLQFKADNTTQLQELIAVNTSSNNFSTPDFIETVGNQNLHNSSFPEMVIVTNAEMQPAAEDLANFHAGFDGVECQVVLINEIYNEFSSGQQDIAAIRDYLKMLYDKANGNTSNQPKYLLLMGDASYDYKGILSTNQSNILPAYQSNESFILTETFVSDDFFACLDDDEGGRITGSEDLDIGVGRFPVANLSEAQNIVNKIKHYTQASSLGSWRNKLTFVADDEDSNVHLNDADGIAETLRFGIKTHNVNKIYLDAFKQVNASAGDRYPEAKSAILRELFTGTFMVNFAGHGNPRSWTTERVFNIDDIQDLKNKDNLPLFVTATCDYSVYDNHDEVSAGEALLLNPDGGAIALLSTTRLVYASQNEEMNKQFMRALYLNNGNFPTLGDAIKTAKNNTFQSENNRKFVLLGDPALTLEFPNYEVKTTSINANGSDTLSALSKVVVTGIVTLPNSNTPLTSFNGEIYPTVYDKLSTQQTRGNDSQSPIKDYNLRNRILFKGKASVVNGEFTFEFIVPKDINYSLGSGKISYYASNETEIKDANGYDFEFTVGGTASNFTEDNDGPIVELFMNDENFVSGGITDANPILLANLFDDSGINTVGNGVGHDIVAILDGNTQNQFVLNDFYQAELDDFTKGKVFFPFNDLEDGPHNIEVTAWDVHNNKGTGTVDFIVSSSEDLLIQNLLNYPNPFFDNTSFVFEHNKPGEQLNVKIDVYSMSGNLLKTLSANFISEGFKTDGNALTWDGTSDYGTQLSKGVYLYKLSVYTEDGKTAQEFDKLVILR